VNHKLSRETLSTLAPQDDSLKEDRSANPPQYDVVVTIGCFDLFHEGHVKLMQRMRSFGHRLIVGLHDDESINLLKGWLVKKKMGGGKYFVECSFLQAVFLWTMS
jgi:cytidyltransferase-like protein